MQSTIFASLKIFTGIMSNEKNSQSAQPKKERVSILESIRRRTGLLVGIVGLALVIFILESLLGSGASIFGNSELTAAGFINGKKVDRNDFIMRLENQLNNYRQRNNGRDADDAARSQAIETVWQQYVVDLVMRPEFADLGISVGEDELYETVVANPVQTIIQNLKDAGSYDQFARPDGSFDLLKWKQAILGVQNEQEQQVKNLEEQVKITRLFEKFRSVISKGLYVTTEEATRQSALKGKHLSVSIVGKRLDAIADSTVKITDEEIQKYYDSHAFQFFNPETSRKVEYVTFNVVPTESDVAAIEKIANEVAAKFRESKSGADDSTIMMQENESGAVIISDFSKKNMPVRDSSVYKAPVNTVFGPYNEGAYYKVYKLSAVNSVADSARIRHILVGLNDAKSGQPKRSLAMAKKEADSIVVLLKAKQANFDSLVMTFSDDQGSLTNGGDYGWFNEEANFVEPFKKAGLMGVKGNISAVETQFGYHIIEVLDVSKSRHSSYKIAQVMKLIAPSEETTNSIFAKANQFSGENNTAELFDKAVEKEKLTKRLADNLKDGEYQVPGLDSPKELVKWAYTAKKGEVSLFNFNNRFVVAKLAGIKEKGTLPLEEVKDEVTFRAKQEKKAELLLAEFKSKAGNLKSRADLDALAAKLGVQVFMQPNLDYAPGMVDLVGKDNIFVGKAFGSPKGVVIGPFKGESGVYVFMIDEVREEPQRASLKEEKDEIAREIAGRADYEVFNALKEKADVTFFKGKID